MLMSRPGFSVSLKDVLAVLKKRWDLPDMRLAPASTLTLTDRPICAGTSFLRPTVANNLLYILFLLVLQCCWSPLSLEILNKYKLNYQCKFELFRLRIILSRKMEKASETFKVLRKSVCSGCCVGVGTSSLLPTTTTHTLFQVSSFYWYKLPGWKFLLKSNWWGF